MRDRCGRDRVPGGARGWRTCIALVLTVIAAAHVHAVDVAARPAARTQTPPSGEILHERDGRAYRIERVAKAGAKYERIGAHTVRYFPFARYEVAREDADYFYVKQYIPVEQKPVAPAMPEMPAPVDVPRTNRYALRDFGRGLPHAGQWRGDFALADVDGDGHLDLAFAPPRKSFSKPVILRGDGHGEWTRWTALPWPELPYDYGAAVAADFDADGHADLAFAMHLRGLAVLAGDGKGGFVRRDRGLPLGAPGSKTPAIYSSHQLGALDWNGDGKPDLIALDEHLLGAAHPYGSVAIFIAGRDSWKPAALPKAKLPRGNLSLAHPAGGRGDRAIVVGDASDGRLTAYEFSAGRVVARALDGVPAGALVRASAAADAGDGRSMLAIAYQSRTKKGWQTSVDVFHRRDDGYAREPLLVEPLLTIGALAFGHLASARATDLAALRSDGSLLLFAADAKGSYTRDHEEPATAWRTGCAGHALQLRDIDGDGRDEIVAAFAGESNAMMFRRDCVGGGGVEAWHVADATRQD